MSFWKSFFSIFLFRGRLGSDEASSGGIISGQPGLWGFKNFIDLMSTGFAYFEVIHSANGDPVDCRYLFVNSACEKIIGLRSGEVVGKPVRGVAHGIEQDWIPLFGRVATTGEPATIEGFSSRFSRQYDVHVFSPQRGFCAVTFEDITERVQAEEKTRQAYARLSSIAESSPDMIFRSAPDGVIQYVSPAIGPILGYAPEDAVGKKFHDLLLPEDIPAVQDAQSQTVSGYRPGTEFRAKRADGQVIHIEVNSMPIVEQGRVVGEQGSVRDITERKRAQEALQQKTKELELERQNLQAIFNSAQVGMCLLDQKGIIRRVNEAAARMVRRNQPDFLGLAFGEAFYCKQVIANRQMCGKSTDCAQCALNSAIQTVLSTGQPLLPREVPMELVIDGKPSKVWLEIGATRVSVAGNEGAILSIVDITRQKVTEASLRQSEKNLGDIIAAFPLPFYYEDAEGRYQIFNQTFSELVGLPDDKIRLATVYDIAPKEFADVYYSRNKDLLLHPGSQVFEALFRGADGSLRDVVFFKRTLHDNEGTLLGVVGTIFDITERKMIEVRIKDSERRLQEFLDAVPVPMFLKNTDGTYVFCNQAFGEFNGIPSKDIIGRTIRQIASESIAEQLESQDKKLFYDGQPIVSEIRVGQPGVSQRDVVVYKSVHYDSHGRIVGIVGTVVDITERKKAEEEIEKRGEELKGALTELQTAHNQLQKAQEKMVQAEKLAAIGLLAAGVAHEINNPLGFIGSNLSILEGYVQSLKSLDALYRVFDEAIDRGDRARIEIERRKISDHRRESDIDNVFEDLAPLMKETREGFERIHKIVSELRDFSRADKGREESVDVNSLVANVLSIIWNEIKYKVELHKDLGAVPLIRGNPQQLEQVLMNILVNAAQAIRERGIVNIRTYQRAQNVVIEIEDNGEGIPREIMGKIFDPFFTTKAPGEGTGLGLSVSYDIIKRHGGSVGAESEVGKGTTFVLTLPVEGASAQA